MVEPHAKYVTIECHLVDPKALYALSINTNMNYDDLKNSNFLKRDECMMAYMAKWLMNGMSSFDYYLFPECKNGRIHFHGFIRIIDPLEFELFVLPVWKEISTYTIKEIKDKEWWTYCTKQYKLWSKRKISHIKRNLTCADCEQYKNTGEAEKIKVHKKL